jgi:hypothetical protein
VSLALVTLGWTLVTLVHTQVLLSVLSLVNTQVRAWVLVQVWVHVLVLVQMPELWWERVIWLGTSCHRRLRSALTLPRSSLLALSEVASWPRRWEPRQKRRRGLWRVRLGGTSSRRQGLFIRLRSPSKCGSPHIKEPLGIARVLDGHNRSRA